MASKRTFFLVFVLCLLFMTCQKDDNPEYWQRDYSGEISAERNGTLWEALIYGHKESEPTHIGADFNIHVYNDVGFLRESLYLFRVPVEEGKHFFVPSDPRDSLEAPGASYLSILADGDVAGDQYWIITSEENFIEVHSADADNFVASFQISFLRDTTSAIESPSWPDTIRFINGYLQTQLR